MRRTVIALGVAGAFALSGCGAATPAVTSGTDTAASDVAGAALALQQVGFDTGLASQPPASAQAGDAPRRPIRKLLRKNTLHGEIVVETKKNGTQTVVVQRGSVTAVTSGGVTVKSTDGFTLTWAYGPNLRVVQDRRTVPASALKTGQEIGVAGVKAGAANTARLIAIP